MYQKVDFTASQLDQKVPSFGVRIEPGQPGFEKSIYILFGLTKDGLVGADGLPKNPVRTAVVADLGGMYFPGAGGVIIMV